MTVSSTDNNSHRYMSNRKLFYLFLRLLRAPHKLLPSSFQSVHSGLTSSAAKCIRDSEQSNLLMMSVSEKKKQAVSQKKPKPKQTSCFIENKLTALLKQKKRSRDVTTQQDHHEWYTHSTMSHYWLLTVD